MAHETRIPCRGIPLEWGLGGTGAGIGNGRRQYRHVESIFSVTLLRTVSMAEPTEQNATHEGIAKGE